MARTAERSTGCARRSSRSATTSGSRTTPASARSRSTARPCGCGNVRPRGRLGRRAVQDPGEEAHDSRQDGDRARRGTVATVKKALITPLRDRFSIEVDGGEDMEAQGNIVDHDTRSNAAATKLRRCPRAGSGSGTRTASRSNLDRTSPCACGDGLPRSDGPRLRQRAGEAFVAIARVVLSVVLKQRDLSELSAPSITHHA